MPGETPEPAPMLGGDDGQAIRKLSEGWLAALRAKDLPRLSAMVTDDAVLLPPGFLLFVESQPSKRCTAPFFRNSRLWRKACPSRRSKWPVTGRLHGEPSSSSWFPRPVAGRIEMQGKAMSILKRQPDGSWTFARGINNTLPKPAVP